ncbi:MAG: HIRAN domain-containing protein [Methanobrevibacter sp.]|nr:HIRAN domain-containing protein [Methanobrevibacter sp.]
MDKQELYTTIVGLNNYEGNKVFKIGSIVRLVKEPDNDYDLEAIACESRYVGKTGYIANSTKTVTKGTMSAGRIYDKIDNISFCEVKFVSKDSVIAKVLTYEEIKELQDKNNEDAFFNPEEDEF